MTLLELKKQLSLILTSEPNSADKDVFITLKDNKGYNPPIRLNNIIAPSTIINPLGIINNTHASIFYGKIKD